MWFEFYGINRLILEQLKWSVRLESSKRYCFQTSRACRFSKLISIDWWNLCGFRFLLSTITHCRWSSFKAYELPDIARYVCSFWSSMLCHLGCCFGIIFLALHLVLIFLYYYFDVLVLGMPLFYVLCAHSDRHSIDVVNRLCAASEHHTGCPEHISNCTQSCQNIEVCPLSIWLIQFGISWW